MSTPLAAGEMVSLSVRIPKPLKSSVRDIAQARRVSVSALVADLIEKAAQETGPRVASEPPKVPRRATGKKAASGAAWRALNDRRIDLIFQKRDHSLTEEEQAELERLQEEASRHVNRVLPLPMDALAESEAALQGGDRG